MNSDCQLEPRPLGSGKNKVPLGNSVAFGFTHDSRVSKPINQHQYKSDLNVHINNHYSSTLEYQVLSRKEAITKKAPSPELLSTNPQSAALHHPVRLHMPKRRTEPTDRCCQPPDYYIP